MMSQHHRATTVADCCNIYFISGTLVLTQTYTIFSHRLLSRDHQSPSMRGGVAQERENATWAEPL